MMVSATLSDSTGLAGPTDQAERLTEFRNRAANFNAVVSLPQFESTSNELAATVQATINKGNSGLDRIGSLKSSEVNFQNTVGALDNIGYDIGLAANRLGLIKETSVSSDLRDAATEGVKQLQEWIVGIEYREDVYKAIKVYSAQKPKLKGEDAKLLADTMRDYRRAGLDLTKAQRDEVEAMRKDLERMQTDFESNVNKARAPLKFTKTELDGVPEGFLEQIRTGKDE